MKAQLRLLNHREAWILCWQKVCAEFMQLKPVFWHWSREFATLEGVILWVEVSTHDHWRGHILGAGDLHGTTLL